MTTTDSGQDPGSQLSTKLFYGIGSVAYGIKDQGFGFFLLIYYNQVLGLEVWWAGLAIMIALVVDAISDPLVGHFSDNLHSKWGRRHPFMYAAAIPVTISFYFIWNPPADMSQMQLFFYMLVSAVMVRFFITIYEIPATGMLPELTSDYDQRTSMFSFRYFFGWAGGISMASIAYLVLLVPNETYEDGILNKEGYETYGFIASVLIFIAIMVSSLGTHRHIPDLKQPPPKQPFTFKRTARELYETLSNKAFLIIFLAGIFHAAAQGLGSSMNAYINFFFWEFTTREVLLLTVIGFISAAIALVLAPIISKRFGKKWGAIGVACLGQLMIPLPLLLRVVGLFPQPGSEALLPTLIVFTILDVAFIITAQTLFSAMVADIVEDSELKTGRRSEGTFFAARTFIYKSVNGIGIMFATLLLAFVAFPQGAKPGEVDPEIIRNMGLAIAFSLVFLYLCMIFTLSRYTIDRSGHEENLKKLSGGGSSPGVAPVAATTVGAATGAPAADPAPPGE